MKLRRSQHEIRFEMTPLIDVVFLLLTFFVFSLVLMVRADVLEITLPELTAGQSGAQSELLTLGIDSEGAVLLAGEPVDESVLLDAVVAARAERPDARLVIAVDESAPSRALLAVVDRLAAGGVTDFAVLGSPSQERGGEPVPTQSAPTQPGNESGPAPSAEPQ